MRQYKIEVNHVSKAFKMYDNPTDKLKEALSFNGKSRHTDFYAISDLDFKVEKGEILGIMGRNGAGKSTLLKMITGIYEPTSGSILVNGRISSLLELGTGFNMDYTGIENIFFYGTLMGFTKKQMEAKLDSVIAFAEIGDYIYQPVKTYSSGMFARLAFSCAINVEPDILIVDEILSVGDMRFQAKCFNKFKEFRDQGVTILYVGHDVGMMRTFCTSAMWIDKGRLVDRGDTTFISAKYTEYMYMDDITDFSDYQRLEKKVAETKEKEISTRQSEEEQTYPLEKKEQKIAEPHRTESKVANSRFPDSIAHWGSHTGLLKDVGMYIGNERIKAFSAEDVVRIDIFFDVDETIDIEKLSIAFSIKNTEGTDIIVKTSYDEKVKLIRGKNQKISFELNPRLANGDYYLVIAVENRSNAAISYYEYVEGAFYFKMYTHKKIFGMYDAKTKIVYLGENKVGKSGK